LNPGDTYHLAFTTAAYTDALSTDIATYNNFVQMEASLNPTLTGTDEGVTYTAIVSTINVDAFDNAPVSAPVYLVNGIDLVANSSLDLWDGTISHPIDLDQYGGLQGTQSNRWTGTSQDGTASSGLAVGGNLHADTTIGRLDRTTFHWIDTGAWPNTTLLPLYAISSVIIVTPIPPALWLFGTGLLGLIGIARRKKA
jgi:hypothetical protein